MPGTAAEHDHRFGSGEPFSIGVEEELFLVDPITGRQTNSSAAVLERLDDTIGTVERELHACQIELITKVHASVGEAVGELAGLRRAVVDTGAAVLGSGTHPAADEGDAAITDKHRYERIHFLLGDAVVTPVGGLHIHVGMPDSETAIKVFNGLRRDLPLLQALAANSPFRHGRDTGLASARELSLRGWPRSGAPRALRDFADFCELSQMLTRAADVPDYTWFWWKLRPHPRLGTVEVRALDAQSSLIDAGALIALVHCLARDAAERRRVNDPPPELVEEGMFRAARFGVHGELPDTEARRRPVTALLEDALERADAWAAELGCTDELARLPELLRRGGGAGMQRATHEIAGIDAVLRDLLQRTCGQ
ncbi:MAG: YbdK family carboxylate-amine ligase [Alphaproteobacteria bacterium]|nr:YbdK family carboxylate-amine ligase [Alphaproteobacteria bacterium]